VGFKLNGKMCMVNPEFDKEQVRYEHRFASFACLMTPPPVQYAEFREAFASYRSDRYSPIQLYMEGCKHFHTARNHLETLPNPDQEVNITNTQVLIHIRGIRVGR